MEDLDYFLSLFTCTYLKKISILHFFFLHRMEAHNLTSSLMPVLHVLSVWIDSFLTYIFFQNARALNTRIMSNYTLSIKLLSILFHCRYEGVTMKRWKVKIKLEILMCIKNFHSILYLCTWSHNKARLAQGNNHLNRLNLTMHKTVS